MEVQRGRVPDLQKRSAAAVAARDAQATFRTCAEVMGLLAESIDQAVDAAVDAWRLMPAVGNA